jgi:hypothetical protein
VTDKGAGGSRVVECVYVCVCVCVLGGGVWPALAHLSLISAPVSLAGSLARRRCTSSSATGIYTAR